MGIGFIVQRRQCKSCTCGQTVVFPLSNSETLELPLCVLSAATGFIWYTNQDYFNILSKHMNSVYVFGMYVKVVLVCVPDEAISAALSTQKMLLATGDRFP